MGSRQQSRRRGVSDEQLLRATVEHRVSRRVTPREVESVRALVGGHALDEEDRAVLLAMLGLDE